MKILIRLLVGMVLLAASSAVAATISWTDWTGTGSSEVSGVMTFGSDTVDVTFSGAYDIAQTGGGTNYWVNFPSTYTSPEVDNIPPDSDIIRLDSSGTVTITFSQAVVDPVFALVSWNGVTVDFNTPIDILSNGPGTYGSGTPIINPAGDGFYGSGEVHGLIGLSGSFNSISFTHTFEYWHGFTLGAVSVSQAVPEPTTLLLFGSGLGILWLGAIRRRKK